MTVQDYCTNTVRQTQETWTEAFESFTSDLRTRPPRRAAGRAHRHRHRISAHRVKRGGHNDVSAPYSSGEQVEPRLRAGQGDAASPARDVNQAISPV